MKRLFINSQNILALISIGICIVSVLFWFFTLNGMPKQVEDHEVRIKSLEHESIELKTKLNLCLNAIYEIRSDVKQLMKDK